MMPRPSPGQLTLFDEFPVLRAPQMHGPRVPRPAGGMDDDTPPPVLALRSGPPAPPPPPSDDVVRLPPPPPGPDPVFFAVLTGGKVTGEIVAAGLAQKEHHKLTAQMRPADTLHISVLGAGIADDLTEDEIGLLVEAGNAVTMPRFEVSFTEALSFKRKVGRMPLVLPCDDGADAMAGLADALWTQMRERGFTLKSRLTAVYHLTLAYDPVLVPPTPLEPPIRMPVREFALIRSWRGEGRYETIRKWALGG